MKKETILKEEINPGQELFSVTKKLIAEFNIESTGVDKKKKGAVLEKLGELKDHLIKGINCNLTMSMDEQKAYVASNIIDFGGDVNSDLLHFASETSTRGDKSIYVAISNAVNKRIGRTAKDSDEKIFLRYWRDVSLPPFIDG
jgi:hypothetical protein